MDEKMMSKMRKNNMKLFPIYEAIGLDYIFYYGIEVLFLSEVKGVSDSNIVLLSTIFSILAILVQIPMSIMENHIGKRKSLLIGNLLRSVSIILVIVSPNYTILIISNIIKSIGFALTGISASPLLNISIPETKNKPSTFSKIYGKGYSKYCYICATSTVFSGYLYTINPYIPVFLCLGFSLFSTLISYNFIEMRDIVKDNTKKVSMRASINDIKDGFKYIVKSPRLKSLMLMLGIIWGLLCLLATYQTTLLKNVNVSATYIGIIAAIVQIITGLTSKKANDFNNKFKNKSLTILALCMTLGAVIIGVVTILKIPYIIQLIIVTLIFCLRHAAKGVFQIVKNRYMNNFAKEDILSKIYAVYSIFANISRALISYVGSVVLLFMDIKYSTIAIGIIFTILVILVSFYMKPRVGLTPEEYKNKKII